MPKAPKPNTIIFIISHLLHPQYELLFLLFIF